MERIKKYRENGIGYSCRTSELKELNSIFKQDKKLRLKNLTYNENKEQEIITEIENLEDDAVGVIQRNLLFELLKEVKDEINLIVISLSYKNMSEFIGFELGKEISIVYQINQ